MKGQLRQTGKLRPKDEENTSIKHKGLTTEVPDRGIVRDTVYVMNGTGRNGTLTAPIKLSGIIILTSP